MAERTAAVRLADAVRTAVLQFHHRLKSAVALEVLMHIFVGIAGLALILTILWDSFETMVLPRRVRRRVRLTRLFYRSAWKLWSAIARHIKHTDRREGFLSLYGPLSLILLVAIWALSLVLGFAMLQWSVGPALND